MLPLRRLDLRPQHGQPASALQKLPMPVQLLGRVRLVVNVDLNYNQYEKHTSGHLAAWSTQRKQLAARQQLSAGRGL
jgi:hypothetical protein